MAWRNELKCQTRHKIMTKSLECEIYVKGTTSKCVLEDDGEDNY